MDPEPDFCFFFTVQEQDPNEQKWTESPGQKSCFFPSMVTVRTLLAAVQENHPAVIQSTLALVLTSDQDEGLRVFYGISTLLLFSNYPPQMGSQGLRDQMNDSQIRELDFFFN